MKTGVIAEHFRGPEHYLAEDPQRFKGDDAALIWADLIVLGGTIEKGEAQQQDFYDRANPLRAQVITAAAHLTTWQYFDARKRGKPYVSMLHVPTGDDEFPIAFLSGRLVSDDDYIATSFGVSERPPKLCHAFPGIIELGRTAYVEVRRPRDSEAGFLANDEWGLRTPEVRREMLDDSVFEVSPDPELFWRRIGMFTKAFAPVFDHENQTNE